MQALEVFLKNVQSRAFITAKLATGNEDEALDIVQDSMLKLVRRYAERSGDEWPRLFQRILHNAINDWYRRQKVRSILYWWQQQGNRDEVLDSIAVERNPDSPSRHQQTRQLNGQIYQAVQQLPRRQQQAFLLRAWWEYSTEETAHIMGCSQGSVKTSYSRARQVLAAHLSDTVS